MILLYLVCEWRQSSHYIVSTYLCVQHNGQDHIRHLCADIPYIVPE